MSEADRDRLLDAVLPEIVFDGWSRHALRAAGRKIGLSAAEAEALFPGGPRDLVAGFSRRADRRMLARLGHLDLAGMRLHERVAAAIMARLEALALDREAVRHALLLLALPINLPLGARLLYETVDAIWYAASDASTDFSFYTKRALLAGVQVSTTLYWLEDRSANFAATRGFLDRRLGDIAKIPRWRERVAKRLRGLPNPLRGVWS